MICLFSSKVGIDYFQLMSVYWRDLKSYSVICYCIIWFWQNRSGISCYCSQWFSVELSQKKHVTHVGQRMLKVKISVCQYLCHFVEFLNSIQGRYRWFKECLLLRECHMCSIFPLQAEITGLIPTSIPHMKNHHCAVRSTLHQCSKLKVQSASCTTNWAISSYKWQQLAVPLVMCCLLVVQSMNTINGHP